MHISAGIARIIAISTLSFALSACALGEANEAMGNMIFGGSTTVQADYEAMVSKANAHPLGSAQNPVRVYESIGERAYLSRLRCADGTQPEVTRVGSGGQGPFLTMMTRYTVDCGAASPGKVPVFMDMHFKRHEENRPVPGFSITPPAPEPQ